MRICYQHAIISMKAHARLHDISETQLRRYVKSSGWIYGRLQYHLAESMYHLARAPGCRLGLCIDLLMADESRQRLLLQIGKSLLPSQSSHSPSVLIMFRRAYLDLGMSDSSGEQRWFQFMVPWVHPPVPMLSNSAGSLWSALRELPGLCSGKQYQAWFEMLMQLSFDSLLLRALDGAASS